MDLVERATRECTGKWKAEGDSALLEREFLRVWLDRDCDGYQATVQVMVGPEWYTVVEHYGPECRQTVMEALVTAEDIADTGKREIPAVRKALGLLPKEKATAAGMGHA